MAQDQDHPRIFSRRVILKAGALGTLGSVILAACGQPAAAPAPAATTPPAPPAAAATKPPAAAAGAPAATPQSAAAAAQPAAGLTNEQISLLFMGHVAGGQN